MANTAYDRIYGEESDNATAKMRSANSNHIPCRNCKFAEKGKLLNSVCSQYPDGKLEAVYFYNIGCPKFEKGEDLLGYQAIKQIEEENPYEVKEWDMTKTVFGGTI